MYDLKLDKLYIVTWKDHVADSVWKDKDETAQGKPAICTSIGWLKGFDDESIKIHSTISDDVSGGEMLILTNCITEIEEIWFP